MIVFLRPTQRLLIRHSTDTSDQYAPHLAIEHHTWIEFLNDLFYGPELYRRTGRCVKFFLMDEKPSLISVGSAGEQSGGTRKGSLWRRLLEFRASGADDLCWQAVFGLLDYLE